MTRPFITAVHVLSVPAPLGRPGQARERQLSIGLATNQSTISWGNALIGLMAADTVSNEAIQERFAAVLVGQSLSDPLALIATIEDLLDDPDRPLPSAIGYGTTLALMAAEARLQGRTMAETIAATYHLGLSEEPLPIAAEVHDYAATAPIIDEMIADQPAALGYRFTGGQLREAMGQRGEILQRFLRELQQRVVAFSGAANSSAVLGGEAYQPALYFALRGGIGEIAAASTGSSAVKSGPVLGFLAGLEHAAQPFPLLIEDPVVLDTLETQVALLAQLRSFMQIRKMNVKLVGRAYATSLESIAFLVNAKAADYLWLDGAQLGSLSRLMAAVAICRHAGVGVILGGRVGESAAAAQAACHVALACRPDFLLAHPGQGTGVGFALVNQELARARAGHHEISEV